MPRICSERCECGLYLLFECVCSNLNSKLDAIKTCLLLLAKLLVQIRAQLWLNASIGIEYFNSCLPIKPPSNTFARWQTAHFSNEPQKQISHSNDNTTTPLITRKAKKPQNNFCPKPDSANTSIGHFITCFSCNSSHQCQ